MRSPWKRCHLARPENARSIAGSRSTADAIDELMSSLEQGKRNRQIANFLFLDICTPQTHLPHSAIPQQLRHGPIEGSL